DDLVLKIENPRLWSPKSPYLYNLKILLKESNQNIDIIKSYFGMRKISLGKDEKGKTRIMLNNEFVFQLGPLDQGFWPDGIYTAPTDAALRYDIEVTKLLGFNMTRKHVKVEPDRWYYWCDRLGLLVWQDMPSANNKTPESKQQFEFELEQLIKTHRNHPSIIMWVVFNEGWGQYDTERLVKMVKGLDPERLVNNASGWTDKQTGDIHDIHMYPGPAAVPPEKNRAAVLGEFGGLGLKIEGHTWEESTWGYRGTENREHLTRRYQRLLQKLYEYKDDPGLSAGIYTQITDVETEANGLMTYDREIIKVDDEKAFSANRGDFSTLPEIKIVVPTSQKSGLTWKYTFEKPEDNWFDPDYDDSSWKTGKGGFGKQGTPGAVNRTEWTTENIWLRREFDFPSGQIQNLQLYIHHDEDADVYINGIPAAEISGYTTDYEESPISPEALAGIKPGRNSIAVYCKNARGGQYIDIGFVELVEK
ncbi:glycoside hydrolase family 2 TIM barrel-domain containing protein, partial [candidate division KSB1 bacterium]